MFLLQFCGALTTHSNVYQLLLFVFSTNFIHPTGNPMSCITTYNFSWDEICCRGNYSEIKTYPHELIPPRGYLLQYEFETWSMILSQGWALIMICQSQLYFTLHWYMNMFMNSAHTYVVMSRLRESLVSMQGMHGIGIYNPKIWPRNLLSNSFIPFCLLTAYKYRDAFLCI